MVSTLPEPKKKVISSIRSKLLNRGFVEGVEYDAINVEPVLTYTKNNDITIFLRYKWLLVAQIPVSDVSKLKNIKIQEGLMSRVTSDEEGNRWMIYNLPDEETDSLYALDLLSTKDR